MFIVGYACLERYRRASGMLPRHVSIDWRVGRRRLDGAEIRPSTLA